MKTRQWISWVLVSIALVFFGIAGAQTLGRRPVERVSVSTTGEQSNGGSGRPAISADGRFVAFASVATNLVPGDTNGMGDVFLRDRQAGTTIRVSVDSAGRQANGGPYGGTAGIVAISADGRFVAFDSNASNLVPGDTNNTYDVFVHDRQTGDTSRVSVDSAGQQATWFSGYPAISADGRFVAFASLANNLAPGDTNGAFDIFLHDRQVGTTSRISVDSGGQQVDKASLYPAISTDGRFVVFASGATNLVPGDTNNVDDVFVRDRLAGTTTRVSISGTGQQGNGVSFAPDISPDGRFVTFQSEASNLVPGDTNGKEDIFVHDRLTGSTTRVSVDSGGQQANDSCFDTSISADGRFVAFASLASNLVPGDTNANFDVFAYDRLTGIISRVSVDNGGRQAEGFYPKISADGRFVALVSIHPLVPEKTSWDQDVFVIANVPDADGDGVPDAQDNCPHIANADQQDSGGKGLGDACSTVAMTDLGKLSSLDAMSQASDINNRGQVVGVSGASPLPEKAFLWRGKGQLIALGSLGGSPTYAHGINDHGQVSGTARTQSGASRAYLLTPVDTNGDGLPDLWFRDTDGDGINDLMGDLGDFAGLDTFAFEINLRGEVAGGSSLNSAYHHAVIWRSGLPPLDLGTLGGLRSTATAINDWDQVAGWSHDGSGALHAYLWNDVGGFYDLGTLNGCTNSEARNLNLFGEVVGSAGCGTSGSRAFLWTSTAGLLNLTGDTVGDASDISGLGEVVGSFNVAPLGQPAKSNAFYLKPLDTDGDGNPDLWFRDDNGDGINDLLIPLGALGGAQSSASGINDKGKVVGWAETSSGERHAFVASLQKSALTPAGPITSVQFKAVSATSAFKKISLTFDEVTNEGETSLTTADAGPMAPAAYQAGSPSLFYDLSTTAAFTGNVAVSIDYSGIAFAEGAALKLMHYEDTNNDGSADKWVDCTTALDPLAKVITGKVSSFSLFAIFAFDVQPGALQPPLGALDLVAEPAEPSIPDKAFKKGSTLPFKFQLLSFGQVLTDADVVPPQIVSLTRAGDSVDLVSEFLDAGQSNDNGTLFRFSDGYWMYNLSTKTLTAGSYLLTIQMPDHRTFQAAFVLR